jgi:hypothetical protein
MKKLICVIFLAIFTMCVFASTVGEVEFTCPLCNTKFSSLVQFSYSIFGQNLDLRRWGAAIIPSPIPKCPNCNFVFNDGFFSEDEINILKSKFETNNIFEAESDMPNYYYLARECELLNKEINDIIYWFLSAVWENKDENKKIILINATISYIDKLNETDESYNTYQLVKLDLLRRSGQFEEALNLIEKIKQNNNIYKNFVIKIIDLQVELIEKQDRDEHPVPKNN